MLKNVIGIYEIYNKVFLYLTTIIVVNNLFDAYTIYILQWHGKSSFLL